MDPVSKAKFDAVIEAKMGQRMVRKKSLDNTPDGASVPISSPSKEGTP